VLNVTYGKWRQYWISYTATSNNIPITNNDDNNAIYLTHDKHRLFYYSVGGLSFLISLLATHRDSTSFYNYYSERISKISQYLIKLWQKTGVVLFWLTVYTHTLKHITVFFTVIHLYLPRGWHKCSCSYTYVWFSVLLSALAFSTISLAFQPSWWHLIPSHDRMPIINADSYHDRYGKDYCINASTSVHSLIYWTIRLKMLVVYW